MNKEYLNNLLQSTIGVPIGDIWTRIKEKATEICSHKENIFSSVVTAYLVNANSIMFSLYIRHSNGITTKTQFEENILMDWIHDEELIEALKEYGEVVIKTNIH